MRVAVIAPPWVAVPPPAYGGTERVLDVLCRSLARAGHEVLLYATGDSTCPVDLAWTYDTALGTDQITPAAELRHVVDAYEVVRAWGADIVHDHTLVGPFYAQRHPQLAVVTTNHGPFDGDLAALYRSLSGEVPIVAISYHQAMTADRVSIAAVIHHGLDVARMPVGDGRGDYALFLGRMHPTKGVDVAIDVARAAGMPLRIVAKMREPAEREYFAACVEPHLGGDVEYLGEVGGEAKLQLLADATCLLNPIRWPEPFGMVMIEALSCGTPVVATPQGAAPEIVDDGETGFLRSTPEELAAAVRHAGDLRRTACRAAAEARFTGARMARDHLELYTRTLVSHGVVRRRPANAPPARPGIPEMTAMTGITGMTDITDRPELTGMTGIPTRPELTGMTDIPARPELTGMTGIPARPEMTDITATPEMTAMTGITGRAEMSRAGLEPPEEGARRPGRGVAGGRDVATAERGTVTSAPL